jgi:hypothetical protein
MLVTSLSIVAGLVGMLSQMHRVAYVHADSTMVCDWAKKIGTCGLTCTEVDCPPHGLQNRLCWLQGSN